MEKANKQLINVIHKTTWNIRLQHEIWKQSEADPDNAVELEDLSFEEKYIYGKKEKKSKNAVINPKQLLTVDNLNIDQQSFLAIELENPLKYFHFILDFQENYPYDLCYPFIRKLWRKKQVLVSSGGTQIEFCDFYEDKCPFPRRLSNCNEIASQMSCDEELVDSNFALLWMN